MQGPEAQVSGPFFRPDAMHRLTALLIFAALCGCAQQPSVQPAIGSPAPAPAPTAPAAPPAVVTLAGAICEPARTGETILKVQLAADRLIERIQADPAYGGAWYEHSPCYRLVLGFADGRPRQWVVELAEPELRPYLAFGRTRLSQAQREQARLEIMAALRAAGARAELFAVSLDPEAFTVGVPTEADAQIARQAIPPAYRDITRVEVGDFRPVPERLSESASSADADVLRQPQLTMQQIAELQLKVIPLNQAVRQMPGFSDLHIQHEPTWHVVVAFTQPPPPRARIVALAPPAIRDRVVVRTAKRTSGQISAAMDALAAAVRTTGVDWTGGYSPVTQRFTVTVGTPANVERVRAVVPREILGDTDVVVGLLPVPE